MLDPGQGLEGWNSLFFGQTRGFKPSSGRLRSTQTFCGKRWGLRNERVEMNGGGPRWKSPVFQKPLNAITKSCGVEILCQPTLSGER